jgi:hypothetical protein
MADFKISRLRYTWTGPWVSGTAYNRDDVVRYGGATWACLRQHTSATFAADLAYTVGTQPLPGWSKMTDGYQFRGSWGSASLYNPGDTAVYGGVVYLCLISHTSSSTFAENNTKWTAYTVGSNWLNEWTPSTPYGVGDLVKYGGVVYRCIVEHSSGNTAQGLENNQASWASLHESIEYKGVWTVGVRYKPDDLVRYGGSILRCTTGHVALSSISSQNFALEFSGFNFYQEWTSSNYYAIGDLVRHGGYVYRANNNNNDTIPDTGTSGPVNNNWTVISKGINFAGDWSPTSAYKVGDIVRRGGYVYVALIDIPEDGSSLDYLDSGNWEVVIPGETWQGSWEENNVYSVGDLTNFDGNIYRCNTEHASTTQNYPGDNGSGYFYWDLILGAGANVGMDTRGDLLTYDLTRRLAGDGSTFGETSLPIGHADGLVIVNSEGGVGYETWGEIEKVRYVSSDDSVALDDVVDSERGKTIFKPWRTIRFACDQLETLGADAYEYTIKVAAGEYYEILPIVVPAGVAVRGDELRSVTVKPMPPIEALALDSLYTISVLNRISAMIQSILLGTTLSPSKSPNNTLNPTVYTTEPYNPPQYTTIINALTGLPEQIEIFRDIISDGQAILDVGYLIADIEDYIKYYVNGTGTAPTLSGGNTVTTDQGYLDAIRYLQGNKDFIAEEAVAYMESAYPSYAFDSTLCKRDTRRYVDAWIYDLTYGGNYKSLMAARYYRNAVLGSSTEDMFYVRNSTGIRNMTLRGLTGTLSPPAVNELYRRPTGGAFVSLDPGWGPNDEKVWITTRSCYVQNITTFGDNCVGQKIDGALHAGGNKSIVSNDFTQVISDGIGAWVLNNGRAELVSVFTYYAQIGMFAEDGGVIRATNGNSSYGDFGALADGNDPAESPALATVNNRLTQASVLSALAGEANDEVLIFEFGNAGENYTTADYNIIGSGTNASVIQEEFRDNAVFEFQVRNSFGNPGGVPGGGGYSLIGNNAQSGTPTSITLATNNNNTEAELLGLRVIITSGDGTGQYGYVTAFNDVTKECQISKESNDQPGWDHVVPGYPIQPFITTSAVYRFEPRITFAEPPFTSTDINIGVGQAYASATYGELSQSFTAVAASVGTGTTIEVSAAAATFNVLKIGRNYTVTLQSGGAGYADEQLVTIPGNLVGGVVIENDITITVKSISNDSTNSILTFEYTGAAASGRFVILPAAGNTLVYSSNGDTWGTATLPSTGNWKCAAAGNYKFVAIKANSANAASSVNGTSWTSRAMPAARDWSGVAYGAGIFVAVASDVNIGAWSSDGATWLNTTIPSFGDSTLNQWVDVAYGKNRFVAVANTGNIAAVGTYDGTTVTWLPTIMDVIADSSPRDWTSVAYGNQRFVAISSTGDVGYSFDGAAWSAATMPTPDDSTPMYWTNIKYGQGVFFALCNTGSREIGGDITSGPTTYAATSYDGVVWTPRTLSESLNWSTIAFGNPDVSNDDSTISNNKPMWIAASSDTVTTAAKIFTGARALGRAIVESGRIGRVRLWEPGSGYDTPPSYTITDPNNTSEAFINPRLGDRVLAQPTWLNRGNNYKTSSTTVTVTGDGYADIIPFNAFVTLTGIQTLPGPGAQFRFRGETNFFTVTQIIVEQQVDTTFTATFRVTPTFDYDYDLEHGVEVEIRERYSQVRITGHDFLDVGTGNFLETNYPELYAAAGFFNTSPENEVVEQNGGRVFYTSTDQDGNFRAGELFAVEQASGIVSISADFFDLNGLTELALGGVRLGGSGAVVREFSTDPLFTADSNNVVPTQRAIKAYLANRLNVGGADLLTASFIAGTVLVGPNLINNTAGLSVLIPVVANFGGIGTYGQGAGVSGSFLAQQMFFRSFRE